MDADEKHGWVPGESTGLSHRARAFEAVQRHRDSGPGLTLDHAFAPVKR
jgi:hypothetical protein